MNILDLSNLRRTTIKEVRNQRGRWYNYEIKGIGIGHFDTMIPVGKRRA